MKNDRKNVSNMVIAIVCVVLFAVTAIYCVPRFSLLSSNALSATVASADKRLYSIKGRRSQRGWRNDILPLLLSWKQVTSKTG